MIEKKLIAEEVQPLTAGRMMRAEDLSLEEKIQAYEFLGFIEDLIGKRKAKLRPELLQAAKDGGDADAKGSYKIIVSGSTVIDEKRQGKQPDEDKLKTLLAEKKIPLEKAFTAKTEWFYDPSKVEYLVSTGKLTEEEIKNLCKVTHALQIDPAVDITKAIEALASAMIGPQKALKEAKKGKK